jgi:methyl-accepting chemotaxis protein
MRSKIMVSKGKNLRTWKNLLVDGDVQFHLFYFFLGVSILYSGILAFVLINGMSEFVQLALSLGKFDGEVQEVFLENWNSTKWILICFLSAYVVGVGALTIIYTHRLAGPMVAFKKHIDELKATNFSSRVSLRKNDQFQDLASKLNELAASMESDSSK